ncbi:MAG: hypothetical protein CMJ89_09865 [Planctomycetes bacterium]|nr:hypothetical protein [Planctomycetota bacterium]
MNAQQALRKFLTIPTLFSLVAASIAAQSVTLNVVGSSGETVGGYRWQLEEDRTFQVVPGVSDPNPLSFGFHTSYMPIAGKGSATGQTAISVDPGKTYFLSVLVNEGFGLSGARVLPGQTEVTVVVQPQPLPTAQISIFAFKDDAPLNGAPDLPGEQGLSGFSVILEDALAGGQLLYDAFGNRLGTTYLANGDVDVLGDGTILTDVNGEALIKNLYPGKYGVQLVPPVGQQWIQTTTLEGKKTIDAWVKANEPPFFVEFGPAGYHVFIGFLKPQQDPDFFTGPSTVTGRVVNLHLSRPPQFTFSTGQPLEHTTPWIGINDVPGDLGKCVYAMPANADGTFSISGIPEGMHQLVIWDQYLDTIISLNNLVIAEGAGDIDLGDVGTFQWFGRLENHVFFDPNENGIRDGGEIGMLEQAVNIRYRDGTVYQAFPTDLDGFVPFDQVFPFFHWLVAEVDFARYKATGATITVDAGGPIDPTDPFSFGGVLNPQPQPENGMGPNRTETGVVLTQGIQTFLGQTNVIEWGKTNYGPGENGGVSGIVYYGVTRAEDDPAFAAGEEWEPGIPRVVVNLYQDNLDNITGEPGPDGIIDDLDGDLGPTLADADNSPFDNFPGPEDIDRNSNGSFDPGDAIQTTSTDCWDDSLPTDLPGDPLDPFFFGGKGYDGLRAWNQVRPAIFDGGYAFDCYFPGGIVSGAPEEGPLPVGTYIVEAVPPRSESGAETYMTMAEEHKNVDFGDEYTPSQQLIAQPPPAVGDLHLVPAELTLFPGVPAPFAGEMRPLADRKQVAVQDGMNTACDFWMLTEVPIGAHVVGFVLNDLANEFDPNSPQFGEKQAPPFLPVTFRDWTGHVLSRVHTDEYGKYNAVLPSTFTIAAPSPSGVGPNMLTVTVNDGGVIPDPANPGAVMIDPFYDPQFSQFTYTFQFMPGATTYLDTPVVPVAAFAGPDQFPLDCQPADGQPRIFEVSGPLGGPYVSATGQTLTIRSAGTFETKNPAYTGAGGTEPKFITRDFGFGPTPGDLMLGEEMLTIMSWSASTITAMVPAGAETAQLTVKRGDNGMKSDVGITVTVGSVPGAVTVVMPDATPNATPIQDAINAAAPGDLLLVQPGIYEESVILWKPLHLQGSGQHSTIINAIQAPSEKMVAWRALAADLVSNLGVVDLLPGQPVGFGGLEPETFATEEGSGIFVLAKDTTPDLGGFGLVDGEPNARIDGFTISGSSQGGGIVVNGYARNLQISNNRITGNHGFKSGGIRSGHPFLTTVTEEGDAISQSCHNDNLDIHHNRITENGALTGAGGGISLHTGSSGYRVKDNVICGNFTIGSGGGIGHQGLSNGGKIEDNLILFNQSFSQSKTVSGGGLFISGNGPLAPATVSEGSGSVVVNANVIQGNQAGAGNGGGIRLSRINGLTNGGSFFNVDIVNNVIVDNVAGLAGGGISIQDALRVRIVHNTVANNDATATAGEAFPPGNPTASVALPAGIVGHVHTTAFRAALGPLAGEFSNPMLVNNIVWHNRSFHFEVDPTGLVYGLVPDVTVDPPVYRDLEVLGTAVPAALSPMHCLITDTTGYHASNVSGDPGLLAEYVNGDRGQTVLMPEVTSTIQPTIAFDEGGNFVDVRFGPLTQWDPNTGARFADGHLGLGSPALDSATGAVLTSVPTALRDLDGDPRVGLTDIGADETPLDGGPPALVLTVDPGFVGPNTLCVTGGTEGTFIVFLYGLLDGPVTIPIPFCAVSLEILDPTFLGLSFVSAGKAQLNVDVPPTFAGAVHLQAIDLSCRASNLVSLMF